MAGERRTIDLNGAHGEGGGALVRTALAVSALTNQPVHIRNVRGALRKPGLTSEDLTVLKALATICQGEIEGDEIGSTTIAFSPRRAPMPFKEKLDVQAFEKGQTPGNALIVGHTLLPVLARAGGMSRLAIAGETHNTGAMTFDAFELGAGHVHRAQGLYTFPSLISSGFGFGGRGEVNIEIEPSVLEPLSWKVRGALLSVGARICWTDTPPDQVATVKDTLAELLQIKGIEAEIEEMPLHGKSPGLCATLYAQYECGAGVSSVCLGRGVRPGEVSSSVFSQFLAWWDSSATVDVYLADQMLLPACFANGKTFYSTPQITRRLLTMTWVIKEFVPLKITVLGREGEAGTVAIER
jgi:RNA 3'-terminal phosphate cyclase (ATP)